jgi:threonine dehydrogenase-like Zn-dependent dehydrogenase
MVFHAQALQVETDSGDMLNELITSVRKGGRISIIGVYAGYVNHLNIGEAAVSKGKGG